MAAAKHRAIDLLRRNKRAGAQARGTRLARSKSQQAVAARSRRRLDDDVGDDLLRLVFTACHPVLSTEARVALTLRLLGGLTTDEIARAFLVSEPTVAQRIVRAKRTLAEAHVPFEVPRGAIAPPVFRRCLKSSTLSSTRATRRRRAMTGCGRRSVRRRCVSAASSPSSLPDEPEVHGLVALMEIQASRARARVGPSGEPMLLLDQNSARWDHVLIGRGLAALARAEALGGAPGPYCRARSPPVTRGRAPELRRTGHALRPSMMRWRSARHPRSSSSIARSRSRWPMVRRGPWKSSMN